MSVFPVLGSTNPTGFSASSNLTTTLSPNIAAISSNGIFAVCVILVREGEMTASTYFGKVQIEYNNESYVREDKDHEVSPGNSLDGNRSNLYKHDNYCSFAGKANSHASCTNFHRLIELGVSQRQYHVELSPHLTLSEKILP